MPRFDRGVVNTKLEKGDIVLMGNPTQYGEILAENILVEDILKADLETLISGSNLVRGKFYRITNAVSSTLSLLVQGLTANTICDYAYNTANGDLVTYNISTDLAGVPFSSVYVPYTGATTNVDLGEYQIKVGQLELDQTPTGTFGVGKIRWNDTDGTPEVMLKGANVTLQIGQEQLARVVNKTNTNLTEAGYQVVRISGAQGQRLKVGLAQANSTSTCKDTLGLVTENISNNAEGFITTSGIVRNINTTGSLQGETWADGDRLYLSANVAGGITNVEPSAPNIVIVLGYVVYAHANQGSIYVSVEGAKALHELFDVSIPTPTNNNVLVYESSTGLWKDKSISTILGFTPIANNATVGGELSGTLPNPSLVTSAVTGKALTGLSVSGSAVVSTDSILTGIGKLQNQINAVVGSVNFQGVWNASTNSPSLASGVGTKGYYYVVSVAGSTNLDGITDWKLGDWAIYDGTAWQKVDNTDAVVSVNGYTGIVTLSKSDVGLSNVENTALSTWTGSTNITTLGTINTGVWQGTAIADSYISSSANWNSAYNNMIASASFNTGSGVLILTQQDAGTVTANLDGRYYISSGISGTSGYLPLFGASNTLGNSIVSQSSGVITIAGTLYANATANSDWAGTFENNGTTGAHGVYVNIGASSTGIPFRVDKNGTPLFNIANNGQIITASANNTGEHFIVGGSARVNGTLQATNAIYTSSGFIYTQAGALFAQASGTEGSSYQLNGITVGYSAVGTYGWITAGGAASRTTLALNAGGGNVGIGTTSPSAKLEVKGGQAASKDLLFSLSKVDYGVTSFYQNYSNTFYANGKSLEIEIDGLPLLQLAVNNLATDSKIIFPNGNVGIGITSPAYKLSINGNAGIEASEEYFYFHSDYAVGSNARGKIRAVGAGGGSGFGGDLRFSSRASNNAWNEDVLVINSSGNVLIGTTTDDGVNKLQVSGSVAISSTTGYQLISGGNTLFSLGYSGGTLLNRITGTSLFLAENGTPQLTIASGGAATFSSSVTATKGIFSGGSELIRLQQDDGFISFYNTANSVRTGYLQANTGSDIRLIAESSNVLYFGAGGSVKMTLKTTGVLNLSSLPTSSAGLSAGDIWNDGGTLKIV